MCENTYVLSIVSCFNYVLITKLGKPNIIVRSTLMGFGEWWLNSTPIQAPNVCFLLLAGYTLTITCKTYLDLADEPSPLIRGFSVVTKPVLGSMYNTLDFLMIRLL